MIDDKYCYAESVIGSLHNRPGKIIKLNTDYPDCYGITNKEAYLSVYRFDESLKSYVESNKVIASYNGITRAIGLHFDFDGPSALDDVKSFVERTCSPEKEYDKYKLDIDHFKFYYSGNKGFHIQIINNRFQQLELPSSLTPIAICEACKVMAGCYNSFDPVPYDITRVFRIPNSKNPKSGLFKIPLYAMELWELSIEEIRELAKKQRRLSDPHTIKEYLAKKYSYITSTDSS